VRDFMLLPDKSVLEIGQGLKRGTQDYKPSCHGTHQLSQACPCFRLHSMASSTRPLSDLHPVYSECQHVMVSRRTLDLPAECRLVPHVGPRQLSILRGPQ
jgi:hypothetical protein